MSSGKLSNAGSYSITYNLPYRFYKFVKAYPMGEISSTAQLRLSSLENISKAPKTKRETVLDFSTELDIKHLRLKYIRLGKVKLRKIILFVNDLTVQSRKSLWRLTNILSLT